ncbi:CHASE3 domain-containing protein [Clostridium tagluense]|uniref:ATP-binding protein n=1 Tax=Clostridium tagluense TaxID=360422 RepID=UPI001CF17C73|nr:ATP-binding protein [Clostridium tagluense]MCB2314197.1 CHASE3 domain-containing protein [Clostridium tagluense]MCB2319054.1 CHASE3 domain-containing protein [Clostridium tagluense]MCB2323922.1 CHASE3 domain-containing protein [Clostridium tagluense]MCB2328793.1 CHASE3 domain-containing protein [Clostridium tagluense]MCB2333742.1 CHASE3 domain-containing protein [Clostridium tagluense]
MVKSRSRRTMVLGYFSIACLSLIIILFSIYSMNKVSKECDFIIKKILPAKTFSTEILTAVINEETGIRAYIISEDKKFLEPYYLGNKQLWGYYNSLYTLKNTALGVKITNQLNEQVNSIQMFFKEQIALVDNGKSNEAKLNLAQGKNLVDKFRDSDNVLINKIDLEVNSSLNKVANAQKFQKYLLIFLGSVLTLVNLMFIRYIWNYTYEEVKKKNEMNNELQKLLVSQEEFTANISHELKTPLNVISSAVQLVQMYCYNGSLDERRETISKYLDSMKLNSYRLSKLINNIVDSSKIQAGFFKLNLSNNNIVQVVEEIVLSTSNFTGSKGLHIIFDTDIEEKIIACDPEKIERIVLNLISNAIKFSDKGGKIFVDVKDKNEFVEISVKDNGIGIEEENLVTIFDRFKQVDKSLSRNAEGTGIGLNLVKSIVELHGGRVYAKSEFGKGSKFTVMLPSGTVLHENMLYGSKMKSGDESIQVELSDIYL